MSIELSVLVSKFSLKWMSPKAKKCIKESGCLGINSDGKYIFFLYKDQTSLARGKEILEKIVPVTESKIPAIVEEKYLKENI